jgi:hypothetical protein
MVCFLSFVPSLSSVSWSDSCVSGSNSIFVPLISAIPIPPISTSLLNFFIHCHPTDLPSMSFLTIYATSLSVPSPSLLNLCPTGLRFGLLSNLPILSTLFYRILMAGKDLNKVRCAVQRYRQGLSKTGRRNIYGFSLSPRVKRACIIV